MLFFSKIELRGELQTQKKPIAEGIRNRPISAENRPLVKILDRISLKKGYFLDKKRGTSACMHFFQKNRVTWYTSESKEANSRRNKESANIGRKSHHSENFGQKCDYFDFFDF